MPRKKPHHDLCRRIIRHHSADDADDGKNHRQSKLSAFLFAELQYPPDRALFLHTKVPSLAVCRDFTLVQTNRRFYRKAAVGNPFVQD